MVLVNAVAPTWPTNDIADPFTKLDVETKGYTRTHILLVDTILAGDSAATVDVLKHHALPCLTLGFLLSGVIVRLVRINVIQALKGDYVEAARARGIGEGRVVRKHAFRNALVPVITVVGLQVALTLSGAVLTEKTFNWPGIGSAPGPLHRRTRLHRRPGAGDVLRRGGRGDEPAGRRHQRLGRPEGEVLMREPCRSTIWNTKGVGRWVLLIGIVVTLVFVVFAVFAPVIAPYGFAENTLDGTKLPKLAEPGSGYLFGTNDQFYDIFSRVVWGSRTALVVIVLSVIFAGVIGVPLGLVSGFIGGWVDRLLVFVMDALYSFPALLLAIVFSFLLNDKVGGGVIPAALSLTAIYIPQYFRVVRNTTVSAREATYVEAARAIGAGPFTIMRKYLFSQRRPVGPGDRDAQRGRCPRHAGRPRVPGVGHPAHRGLRVGLRHRPRTRRRPGRRVVAGVLPRHGDHPADHRTHAGG